MESKDLSKFPDISFTEFEVYAQKESGCEHTRKAYKFFAEPGYLHDKKRYMQSGMSQFLSEEMHSKLFWTLLDRKDQRIITIIEK